MENSTPIAKKKKRNFDSGPEIKTMEPDKESKNLEVTARSTTKSQHKLTSNSLSTYCLKIPATTL